MAPVNVTPTGGEGPRWVPVEAEIRHNLGVLDVLLHEMVAKGTRDADHLSYGERYTVGLRAAARWTLRESATTPVSARPAGPDPVNLGLEMGVAEYVAEQRMPGHDMAAGALAWMRWLTGHVDRLVFMAL